MKVAIIDHVGIKAGMDSYDLSLSKALTNEGCETFIYSNFKSENQKVFNVFQFRVSENLFSYFQMLGVYRKIAREIVSQKINQCIVHGFRFGLAEWMLVKALKKSAVKINMIVHDPENLLGRKHSGKWKRKIFQKSEVLIVHNKFSADELSQTFSNFEKKKVVVIPHGHFIDTAVAPTDSEKFQSQNLFDVRNKYLLFFGHIKKTKGLDLLLKAVAKTSSEICLVIAGRMRKHSFDEYMSLIEEYHLDKRVKIFPGYISSDLRNELFEMADAVVLPYRKVYQSGVMLMAMSYGKAVIASDLIPIKEVITDGKNGFLFKTGDEDSLVSAIEKIMRNDVLRNEVAKSGRNYVMANHDWKAIASEWMKLFSK